MIDLFQSDWRSLWTDSKATEAVGTIFTKPEVVSLILDLADYGPASKRLSQLKVLEPSCGDGAFLTELVQRLLESERLHTPQMNWKNPALRTAVRACDINPQAVTSARNLVREVLQRAGCPEKTAQALVETWVIQTDFLLHDWPDRFDVVVGNPPYVRIEDLPRAVLNVYRDRFHTLTDRADLYVAFMQRGLELLTPSGVLAYICANRFTKNKYGAALRRLIAEQFHMRYYLNLEHTQPFQTKVSAYPGIFVIDRNVGAPTYVGVLDDVSQETLLALGSKMKQGTSESSLTTFDQWYTGTAPWITTDRSERTLLDRLEKNYPSLEFSAPGTRVGIGVATGADRVYITSDIPPGVEPSRVLPLVMASDVESEKVSWSGHYLINPFADTSETGALVRLKDYPGLHAYLEKHRVILSRRHVAKAHVTAWYRTIDRVWPELASVPKLLIPDIQSGSVVGYDVGDFYPHHNLYWVTSDTWPLQALQAILRSTLVRRQVAAHGVQMRGGHLRYQAQVLRRVHVPLFERLSARTIEWLVRVSGETSQLEIDAAVSAAFQEGSLNGVVGGASVAKRKSQRMNVIESDARGLETLLG